MSEAPVGISLILPGLAGKTSTLHLSQ